MPNKWINIKDALPEESVRVLVYMSMKKLDSGTYTICDTDRLVNGRWVRWGERVTHWMPLPDAPKEGNGDDRQRDY